jgi:alkaline phosphatase
MPVTGLVKTASLTGVVTDSAAGASAYATGHRVLNRALAVTPDGTPIPSVTGKAKERGLAIGLLTTTDLTDASPAAWAVHVPTRRMHAAIFGEMLAFGPEVMAGGIGVASAQYDRISDDEIGEGPMPVSEGLVERAREAGYTVLIGNDAVRSGFSGKVLAIGSQRETRDAYGPPMEELMSSALDVLAQDPDGFFLFAEVEETDTAGHANDTDRAVAGVLETDRALRVALDFQREHPETLVILTADHDTGGLSVGPEGYASGETYVRWVSGDHTSHWVPVFASGPGAERFTGVHKNTDIGRLLAEALGIEGIPADLPEEAWEKPRRRGIGG